MKFLHGIFTFSFFAIVADKAMADQIIVKKDFVADEMVRKMFSLVKEVEDAEIEEFGYDQYPEVAKSLKCPV